MSYAGLILIIVLAFGLIWGIIRIDSGNYNSDTTNTADTNIYQESIDSAHDVTRDMQDATRNLAEPN